MGLVDTCTRYPHGRVPDRHTHVTHRPAIGYSLDDLKGISPDLCMHKINLEEDGKPVVNYQRRLHPKMKEVVRKEVIRLIEAGIITSFLTTSFIFGWRRR